MTTEAEIRERWAKVELAPWGISNPEGKGFREPSYIAGTDGVEVAAVYFSPNARAIGSAPTDIATLLAENAKFREALEEMRDFWPRYEPDFQGHPKRIATAALEE